MLEEVTGVQRPLAPTPTNGSRWRATCRFLLSAGAGGALSVWLARALRRPLSVSTDIVGYPIHANFNSFNYFNQYYISILIFPLATLVIYELLGRTWARSSWPDGARAESSTAGPWPSRVGRVAPSLAVGLSLGSLWLLWGPSGGRGDLWIVLGLALFYLAVVSGLATLAARRSGGEVSSGLASLDAALAPLSLLLVDAVSRNTWVAVQSPPTVHRYQPLPTSLTFGILVVALLLTLARLVRAREPVERRRIELQTVLVLVIPSLLFAYTAALPLPLGALDLFHGGEPTGAANLVSHGAFPWRDIIFIHGLFQDVLVSLLGFRVFGHSIWGATAGFTFFATPAWWIAFYLLLVYLFPRRLTLVVAALSIPFTAAYAHAHLRYLPYPFILISLGAVIRTPDWSRALLLALCLVGGNLLVPELAYAVPACGLVLVAYDWSHRPRGVSLWKAFPRSSKALLCGAVLSALWALFLLRHHALADFVNYYRTFAPGHELTGAIPIDPASYKDPLFLGLMLLPPLLIVLAIWDVIAARRSGRRLGERDWVMVAAVIVTAAYYRKFLSRADMHVAHSMAPAIPLLFYAIDRLLASVESLAVGRGSGAVRWVGAAALVTVVVAWTPPGSLAQVDSIKSRVQLTVPHQPLLSRLGWANEAAVPLIEQVNTLERFLREQLGPTDTIFDFTNQPGLYHFLLDLKPASRFFHVSMAIRPQTQEQVIADLMRALPRLVVYGSDTGGLVEWDGITNVVRHHEVSRFLLDHYLPLAKVSGQTFYLAKDRTKPSEQSPPGLDARRAYLGAQRCDWGYAPYHLETPGLAVGPGAHLSSVGRAVRLEAGGWAALGSLAGPATEVLAVGDGALRSRARTGLPRPDVASRVAGALGNSGFHLFGEWVSSRQEDPQVRILALGKRGEAAQLWAHPGGGEGPLEPLPAGLEGVRLVSGAIQGNVDYVDLSREKIYEVEFPPELPLASVAGLEVEARATRAGTIAISPEAPAGVDKGPHTAMENRGVVVRVPRTDGVRVRIPVDNCPSWRATVGPKVFIRTDDGIEIRNVRALERRREATTSSE
jgi:hypothetical protein